jgi:predicted ArsR family transcriptional regulator
MAHASHPWSRRFAESTRGRVAELLRERPMTVDEVAAELDVTSNAVRAQIQILIEDGLVERAGRRRSASKPSITYTLTAAAQTQYSRLYLPFLAHLMAVLGSRMPARQFDALMRRVGRALLPKNRRAGGRGSLESRARECAALLNEFGGTARVERADGHVRIRSGGCPLALATEQHIQACHAVESLLKDFSGLSVTTCCERDGAPRCCFELSGAKSA